MFLDEDGLHPRELSTEIGLHGRHHRVTVLGVLMLRVIMEHQRSAIEINNEVRVSFGKAVEHTEGRFVLRRKQFGTCG